MFDHDAARKSLWDAYQSLSPLEGSFFHLCAVLYEPTTAPVIYSCFRKTRLAARFPEIAAIKDAASVLQGLQRKNLLTDSFQCHEAFTETAVRRAATGPDPGLFQNLVDTIQAMMPLSDYRRYPTASEQLQNRLLRDFRIGVYTADPAIIRECHQQLTGQHPADAPFSDPYVQVLQNPFEPQWLRRLPTDIQISALSAIYSHTVSRLEGDADALSYGTSPEFLDGLKEFEKAEYFAKLFPRLLLGGRPSVVRNLISKVETSPLLCGFSGWVLFLEGRTETAVQRFEEDLNRLRIWTKNKNAYFKGLPGIFYILSLMQEGDSALFDKLESVLAAARADRFQGKDMDTLYALMSVIGHVKRFEPASADSAFSRIQTGENPLAEYLAALAAYGMTRALNPERRLRLEAIWMRAKQAGLGWLAMECAVLLNAASSTDGDRTDSIESIQDETGIRSLFSIVEPEEPWKHRLNALAHCLESPPLQHSKPGAHRLAWEIRLKAQHIELIPREQTRMGSGAWSGGKMLPLAQLFNNPQMDFLTQQDRHICASIRKVRHNSRVFQYFFDWDETLPALIGHPLVFLADQPAFPMEIVRGEPKILLERQGDSLRMSFSPKMVMQHIAVTRDTPNRLSIVCLSAVQQRIAGIIGENGLRIPVSAEETVLKTIAPLSASIPVHSTIGGTDASAVEAAPDPLPRFHMAACESGFRVEIFTQPFGRGGPKLKPGEGAERIFTETGGRTYQIHRDLALELKNAAAAEAACPALSAHPHPDGQWLISDPYAFLEILLELKVLHEEGRAIVEWPEGETLRVTREMSLPDLRVRIRGKSGWFEIGGQLAVDDAHAIELKELMALMPRCNKRFVPIGPGRFLALSDALIRLLKAISDYTLPKHRALLFHPAAAQTIDGLTKDLAQLEADSAWETHLERIRSSITHPIEIPKDLKARLREYQIDGYNWLSRLSYWGMGACLADDMGLGKTLQVLAVILKRAPSGPSLVIAPASVCMNWLDEIRRFAPSLKGRYLEDRGREKTVGDLTGFDVLVVSYGLLVHESDLLSSRIWETVVLDEAQVIKNMKAKRSQAAMNMKGNFRIVTTGTPIENHLGELFTLFHFINPGLLGSPRHFLSAFADPIEKHRDTEAASRLKNIIQPFILRRMKSQVLDELPPVTEITLHVDLYPKEAAFYESLRRNVLDRLERSRTGTERDYHFQVFSEMTRLRQSCCHTRLIQPDSRIPSAKLDLFEDLVSDLLENGHKVLVFSQFVSYLSIIREHLDGKRIRYRYLDGKTPMRSRKIEIDAFQKGDGDIFLISLKAGGLGLNLTAADYVIHMDPWWNPAVESQASDRAHRMGQQRPVTVYRLVARNTVEEKMMALHQQKRNLAGSLLAGSDVSGKLSTTELLNMIQEKY